MLPLLRSWPDELPMSELRPESEPKLPLEEPELPDDEPVLPMLPPLVEPMLPLPGSRPCSSGLLPP